MGKNLFFDALTCLMILLCLVSVPFACSLGPLELSFADAASAFISALTGSDFPSSTSVITPEGATRLLDAESLRLILFDLRLPRVLLALCAGAGLAVAGAVFQGILRNPLADPFTLGVSGGAAFGAALAISLGLGGAVMGYGIPLLSFAGAAAALAAVLALGRIGGGLRHETLILAGVVVSALLAAFIALVKALDEASVTGIVFWIMGSFQGRGWTELLLVLPGLLGGCLIAMLLHGRLDMLSLGDRTARHLGLGASRARLVLLLSAGAITASCVAVSGIIGFIGLIVPHLCRMLLGASHNKLLPASALCGGLLLLWSDVAARTILPGGVELPVGVVTALLGGPFFCFILGRKKGRPVAAPGLDSASDDRKVRDNRVVLGDEIAEDSVTPGNDAAVSGDRSAAENGDCAVFDDTLGKPSESDQASHLFGTAIKTGTEEASAGSRAEGRTGGGHNSSCIFCRELCFGYGKRRMTACEENGPDAALLAEISFTLRKGEFVGLLGPNGSGKSTLLHCLSGVLRPWAGEVSVQGHPVGKTGDKERARLLAHLPQKPESVPALSVFKMVLMGRFAYTPYLGGYSADDKRLALESLTQVGALHLAERSADSLSGGELQRVLLARTFAQSTSLILLDEAVSGLDPAFQLSVLEVLKRKNAAQGVGILAAMHDLNLASLYCHRLIFLKKGRIVADGPLAETFIPKVLESVYECEVVVVPHPLNGAPQALLLPGG